MNCVMDRLDFREVSRAAHPASPAPRSSWWQRLFGASAVVAAVMVVSAGARADFRTGNELYADCTSSITERAYCLGYVAAIADAARGGPPEMRNTVYGFTQCSRNTLKTGQAVDIVVRFLTMHPEHRDLGAPSLVAGALSEAFPCR